MFCWWRARARERPERPAPMIATLRGAVEVILILLKFWSIEPGSFSDGLSYVVVADSHAIVSMQGQIMSQ